MTTSPKPRGDLIRLVTAMRTTSDRALLYAAPLTTTAGLCLDPRWSVYGTRTSTTSPNSECVILGVVRVVPDSAQYGFRRRHGHPSKFPLAIAVIQEVDEVLHLAESLRG